ncbi:MAG: hypothetical protein NTW13_00680, partial [Candidatus Omnitrophica bacterium]|nr:hypothetical protein [Candidatus Omnitrophota bacterium]
YPIKSLDYVEIDPLIIGMLKKYPTALTKEELGDKRVAVINTDPRLFLSSSQKLYDLIIIGLSNQADLSTNRLFTQEFFVFAKTKLNPDGILAFWLPGSLTYLSEDLKNLNKCIINALTPVYSYLRVIPEDYNIFIASDSKSIMEAEPALISQRIKKGKIPVNILIPAYLEYRLSREKQDWFNQELAGVNISANRDLRPVGVYNSLLLWNKKFPSSFSWVLNSFKGLNLKVILGCIFLLTILLFYIFRRAKNNKPAIAYSIASTGFFGMLSNLILIFSYQVFFGSLYYKISILISIFMAGIALGSLLIIKSLDRIKIGVRLLLIFEAMIMLFSLVLPIAIMKWPYSYVFCSLLLLSGLFMGLEFPLAAKIYSQDKAKSGETSGMLYAADLTGGWLAGIFTGVVFLPILGVLNS